MYLLIYTCIHAKINVDFVVSYFNGSWPGRKVDLLGVDLVGVDFVRVDLVGGHQLDA